MKKRKTRDWTEPAHLGKGDWQVLKEIKRLHRLRKMREAMSVASDSDTIVREEIPPQVWLDIGGKLTATGLEKLRNSKMKKKQKSGDEPKIIRGNKAALVDTIEESVKLLRRFKNMIGKTIPSSRLLSFIKALQRAVHERRIRKSDKYASEIDVAQRIAVQAYQRTTGKNVEVKAPSAFAERVAEISKSEKVRPSVSFLKRFVGLIGKPWHEVIKPLRKLIAALEFMIERKMITDSDPYYAKVRDAQRAMEKANANRERVSVPNATLQGLNGIIEREDHSSSTDLAGLDSREHEDGGEIQETEKVRTAKQEAEKVYQTFPFTGYYQKLFAEPERNFWMVIYGLPFQGKTTFSVGFAKYLAENMGNVLYVSAEQYGSESLRQVLQNVGATDLTQLHFAKSLDDVESLEPYDIVFIDSATAADMSIDDVEAWRKRNPNKAIVTILQSTKAGDFRGAQFWRHLPSIVAKIANRKAEIEKNQYTAGDSVTLPLPKLVKQEKPATVDETLEGHKKGNRETLVVACGYQISIRAIKELLRETPESIQRILKSTPEVVSTKIQKRVQALCGSFHARVRVENFQLVDFDTKDHASGIAFFHCNVRGTLGELKKVIDEWGGSIFVAMDEVPWE
jgi:hypothetical protein